MKAPRCAVMRVEELEGHNGGPQFVLFLACGAYEVRRRLRNGAPPPTIPCIPCWVRSRLPAPPAPRPRDADLLGAIRRARAELKRRGVVVSFADFEREDAET